MATLKVGSAGGALTPLGAAVATAGAVLADNCPAGYSQVAKFTSVTLPESALNADGTLKAATGLEVDVQDTVSGTIDASPESDLWVASVAPTVTVSTTAPICNTNAQSATAVTEDVTFNASISSVVLTATPLSGAVTTFATPTFADGAVTFAGVTFPQGQTDLTAVVTDQAGNTGSLAQPCTVTVGIAPVVAFTAPVTGKNLCASDATATTCIADANAGTAGWQGTLTVTVAVDGLPATSGTVTFTAAAGSATSTTLGTANIINGVATLAPATIADGNPTTITATTSSLGINGVGTGTRTLIVASTKPAAPTNVQAVVKDRRQTSFTVSWTAPAGAVGYDLRSAPGPIDASVFGAQTAVPLTGTPVAAGSTESHDATGLYIEHNYWFAVAAKDAAGNLSAIVSATPSPVPSSCTTTPCPIRASFNQTIINGPQATTLAGFGYYVDGSGNFVGDASLDILAGDGYGNNAYIFAGSTTAFAGGAPAVTLAGSTPGNYFGSNVANIGDVDGDGLEDIGISSAYESPPTIYIFKGRATWPATVADTAADYKITVDSTFDGSSVLGYPIVKLGDINGDGVGDFACGGTALSPGGGVLVVFGARTFGATANLSTLVTGGRAVILSDATAGGVFGSGITALGATNGTLIVSAPGDASNLGTLTSYKWSGTALAKIGTAYTGATTNGAIGNVLNVLGGGLGLISGNSGLPGAGTVLTFLDGTLAAPFTGTPKTITGPNGGSDTFGTVALGGGFSGSIASLSFIGDTTPDLVVGGAIEGTHQTTVYILDGDDLGTLTTPINAPASAKAQIALPSGWNRTTAYSSTTNINGDMYGDIVLGETDNTNFTPAFRGRVLVLW